MTNREMLEKQGNLTTDYLAYIEKELDLELCFKYCGQDPYFCNGIDCKKAMKVWLESEVE